MVVCCCAQVRDEKIGGSFASSSLFLFLYRNHYHPLQNSLLLSPKIFLCFYSLSQSSLTDFYQKQSSVLNICMYQMFQWFFIVQNTMFVILFWRKSTRVECLISIRLCVVSFYLCWRLTWILAKKEKSEKYFLLLHS